jgi:tetratricopeptide (TPR) repeat protein
MGHSGDERITGSVARELCQRENIKAFLDGSISALGSQYVISLDAINCATGESLTRDQVTASSKENVLSALSQVSTRLRSRLGESLASIQKFDKPAQQVTTTSLDALKAYSLASPLSDQRQDLQAIPLYERAIQLDPNFATAYSGLAEIYSNEGEEQKSIEYMRKAYALRDRVSDRERFALDSDYHWMVTGDLDKEIANDEMYHQTYPREDQAVNDLALDYCFFRGQFEKGIQFGNETLGLDPHARGAYGAITCGYLGLNRPDEARSILEPAITKNPDSGNIRFSLFWVSSALGDEAGAERQLQWASGKFAGAGLLSFASGRFAALGKIAKARQLSSESQELYANNNFKESVAADLANLAFSEAVVGNETAARQQAAKSQTLSRSRSNLPTAALALALIGDSNAASTLLTDLRRRYPADYQVNSALGPCADALSLSARGNTTAALQALQPAARYEFGPAFGFIPLYVRGLVYLRAHQAKEASAEFQKIVDHRSLGASMPVYPLAYIGLARSSSLLGDSAKARSAYQDFLALWKDADPDTPMLKQAKAEYEKLQ